MAQSETLPLVCSGARGYVIPTRATNEGIYVKAFMVLCLVYALIQCAASVHIVTDLALYRSLFCSELLLNSRNARHSPIDDQCHTDSISRQVALLAGTLGLFENIPGTVLVLFYGRISDQYGRRPVLFSLLIGGMMRNVITLLTSIHYSSMGKEYLYLASFVAGISGTNPALRTVTWSMIVDIFPCPHQRLLAFSTIASINYFGMVVGPAVGSALLTCNLRAPLWASTLLLVLSLLAVSRMPETLQHVHPLSVLHARATIPRRNLKVIWKAVLTYATTLFQLVSSRNGAILSLTTFIWNFTGGVMLIVIQYLNQDFEWSVSSGGYFYSIFAALKVFVLLIVLPLLMKYSKEKEWKSIDRSLLTLGLIGDGIAYSGYFFMTSTNVLPFIIVLQALCAPLSVALRVLISQMASTRTHTGQEYGAGRVFAAMSVLEGLGDMLGPALWNGIYAALLGNHQGGLIFLIVGCTYMCGAMISYFYRTDENTEEECS